MTPEKKFNQEVWWVLQAIKKEQLSTPAGENVKINTVRIANRDADSPPTDDISKCLRKLEELGAFKVADKYDPDSYDPYYGANPDWERATEFLLTINQQKFNELYHLYEGGFNHQNSGEQPSTTTKTQSVIKSKTLKLIARDIGNLDIGTNLINFLIDCGVDKELIVYPQTKWRMIYDVLSKLATSNKTKDKEILFKIVRDAIHPFMHGGDISSAKNLLNKFNNYLSYDNGCITFDREENTYKVYFVPTKKERKKIMTRYHADVEEQEKKRFNALCQPKNKEKISLLRKTYQTLIGVVEVFCRNFPRLSQEDIIGLNKHYLTLDKSVWNIIDELQLDNTFDAYKKYPRPFSNLFSAEKELNGKISWDVIRREMSARFGEIETLYQKVNASDILAEPDKQKQLNDVTLYLSELKEKTRKSKKDNEVKKPPATKIEITSMPKLQIKKPESKKKQIKETTLYLNQNGDLYREPKDKHCYPMGQKSNRYRIIRFIATNRGYHPTKFISMELSIKNEKTVRTEIGKMRKNIEKYLKIDGKDFLQGKKESGYRINPKYKIIIRNNE